MGIGHFGKKVIGEEAAAREKQVVEKSGHIYGPRVTGLPKEGAAKNSPDVGTSAPPASTEPETPNPLAGVDFASDQAAELAATAALSAKDFEGRTGTARSGGFSIADVREVVAALSQAPDEPAKTEPDPAAEKKDEEPATISVADIKAAIEENPTAVAEILDAELARVEGARIAALRMLREAEGQRPESVGGPRAEVLEKIDSAITERIGHGV